MDKFERAARITMLEAFGIEDPADQNNILAYSVSREILRGCIITSVWWKQKGVIDRKEVKALLIEQLKSHLEINCSVVSNSPTNRSYIGKVLATAKPMPLENGYMATKVNKKGEPWCLEPRDRWRKLA